jgi:hypothetical protein
MEQGVDAMSTIGLDDTAALRLCIFFYDIAIVSEQCSRFYEFNGLI